MADQNYQALKIVTSYNYSSFERIRKIKFFAATGIQPHATRD